MAYPSSDFKTVSLTSNIDESQHMSESGKTQARRHGGQRFELTIEHPPQTKAEFMPNWAFLRSQQGRDQSFTITLPDKSTPLGAVTGSPKTQAAIARGTSQLAINDLAYSTTDVFYAGDMINFNHSKAYKIVSRVDSGAQDLLTTYAGDPLTTYAADELQTAESGQAVVTIFPPLIEDVAAGVAIQYGANFTMTVKQKNDVQEYNVAPPNIYAHQVDLVEYIS